MNVCKNDAVCWIAPNKTSGNLILPAVMTWVILTHNVVSGIDIGV